MPGRKVNWATERDRYVTGSESLADIGNRLGVTKNAVAKHALDRNTNGGQTWYEIRLDFRRRLSDETTNKTLAATSRSLAQLRERSLNAANLAMEELARRLAPQLSVSQVLMDTKELVQVVKLATTMKLEPSTPDIALAEVLHALSQLVFLNLGTRGEEITPTRADMPSS